MTRVLEIFADCHGKPSIVYENRPHLGSNRLPLVVRTLQAQVRGAGRRDPVFLPRRRPRHRRRPAARSVDLVGLYRRRRGHPGDRPQCPRHLRHAAAPRRAASRPSRFSSACGSSSRRRRWTGRGTDATAGHPALGAAEYSASVRTGSRDLFTFCMCAGGYVMPSVSEPGYFCTNGMSESRHDSPFANSGLVVTIEPHETGSTHPAGRRSLPAAIRATCVYCRRTVVQGADPVGARFPGRPAEPGHAPDQLLPGHRARPTWRSLLPEPVVEALADRPPADGSAVRRAIPPRRHAHRARGPRQLARPDRPRPRQPAKSGGRGALSLRRRGRLRRRDRQRGR